MAAAKASGGWSGTPRLDSTPRVRGLAILWSVLFVVRAGLLVLDHDNWLQFVLLVLYGVLAVYYWRRFVQRRREASDDRGDRGEPPQRRFPSL